MQLYIDGSCLKNPGGIGGWSSVFVKDNNIIYQTSGYIPECTSQQAEILALTNSLSILHSFPLLHLSPFIHIFSDSQYVVNIFNKIYKVSANKPFWEKTFKLTHSLPLSIKIEWIKGHNNHPFNELADKLAYKAAIQYRQSISYANPI